MKRKNPPKCSIVIPALNEEENIEQCLQSLLKQDYPRSSLEIIVIDNGSTDKTVTIAKRLADIVEVKSDCNVGEVRNAGAQLSSGKILVCTDADCTFPVDWISTGVSLLISHDRSIFGGGLKGSQNQNWIERLWLLNPDGKTIQQKDLMGSSIFIKKSDFNSLGGFQSTITSGEDSSLSDKGRSLGFKVELDKQLSVYHLGTPKTLKEFICRQSWHGENYLNPISKSLKDKTFWLTLCYLSSAIAMLIYILSPVAILFLTTTQGCAALLSMKRARRANFTPSLREIFYLIVLDNSYLIGRSIGIARSLKKIIRNTAIN